MTASVHPPFNYRRENRILNACAVVVRVIGINGRSTKISALTDNISSGGLFMHLPRQLTRESRLFMFIRISNSTGLAAIGRIVRTENKGHGLTGFAVCFSQTRLLPLPIV